MADSGFRQPAALLALALFAAQGAFPAAVATVFLSDGAVQGELTTDGGIWRVGKQEIRPTSALCLASDSNLPRLAEFGARFSDGTFLAGKFPDFAAGQANTFESESFGTVSVQAGDVAAIYMGGYPGRFPVEEARKVSGAILSSGEFVAGEVTYVAVRFAGLKVDGRIRKYHLGQLYAVLLGETKATTRTGDWEVTTLNGDRLPGEPSKEGFRLLVRGERRELALGRVAMARQTARALPVEWRPDDPGRWRPMRDGEEQVLKDLGQRSLARAFWQQAPSAVDAKLAPGGQSLVFRAWRQPGFFKGQMTIRITSGSEVLKEIVFAPETWTAMDVIRLSTQTEVRVALVPGADGAHGDRVVWEFLEFYR